VTELTATGNTGTLIWNAYPNGLTGEQALEIMKTAGHSFGSAQADLRKMGSQLAGGPGGGMVKSSATRGQKIKSGQRRPKGINR